MAKKTKADPTGQRVNRRKAYKTLRQRIRETRDKVIDRFAAVFGFNMTVEQKEDFNATVRSIITLGIVGTDNTDRVPVQWYFKPDLELPSRQGYGESIIQFNQLVKISNVMGGTAQIIPIELALTSTDYINELKESYLSGFNAIKGMSDRTTDQVIQTIQSGLKAGKGQGEIAKEIVQRFDVADSSAKRIAVTEVNKAYNFASLKATEAAAKQTGLDAGIIHLSALMPTTRDSHGNRHGNWYSVEEQRIFWSTGANSVNCHCSTKPALLDPDGNVIVNK